MSAAHRSLKRIPLEVFTDLIQERAHNVDADDPDLLRRKICGKLKKFATRTKSNGDVQYDSVTTVGQLLTRISKLTLLRVLDPMLTYEEIGIFLQRIASLCSPMSQTAFDMLHETDDIAELASQVAQSLAKTQIQQGEHPYNRLRHLPTGLGSLDRCLRGGLRIGTITELVGRAGAGKTQFAMQLCVLASRYRQGCIYVDTEKKLNLFRLKEIAEKRATSFNQMKGRDIFASEQEGNLPDYNFSYDQRESFSSAFSPSHQRQSAGDERLSSDVAYRRPQEVLENVTVLSPTTTQELISALVEVEELILVRNQDAMDSNAAANMTPNDNSQQHQPQNNALFPIRLLVIDSIAAPTKRGFGSESASERAAIVFQCAQRLKQLADQLQLAVLVINQVFLEQQPRGSGFSFHGATANHDGELDKVYVKAALGTSWHHCVSTRILLEQNKQHRSSENENSNNATQQDRNVVDNINQTRTATIVKSNVVGLKSTKFEIEACGVVDAADTGSP